MKSLLGLHHTIQKPSNTKKWLNKPGIQFLLQKMQIIFLFVGIVCIFGYSSAFANGYINSAKTSSSNSAWSCKKIVSSEVCTTKSLLNSKPNLVKRVHTTIRADLRKIQNYPIAPEIKKKINSIRITIDESDTGYPAYYHIGGGWLKEKNMDTFKADSVNIPYPESYLDYRKNERPSMLLHELTHGFYFQYLTDDEKNEISEVFSSIVASKKYQRVQKNDRGFIASARAYALENEHEYFSELAESYFGTNDYSPFNKKELQSFDREGYELVEKIWSVRKYGNNAKK